MSEIKIQEAKNGAAQLSHGKYFLMVNKYRIKRGSRVGQALISVRLSHLQNQQNDPSTGVFVEDTVFLLSQKQFDDWLALLVQVSERKLVEEKEKKPVEGQAKF